MKRLTQEQKVQKIREDIRTEIAHWMCIQQYGGNDPFWPDGCNMNLCRNHVIHDKLRLKEYCDDTGVPLPEEYFLPTPPEVDNGYMANRKQKTRVKRLVAQGNRLTMKRIAYDENQMSLDEEV